MFFYKVVEESGEGLGDRGSTLRVLGVTPIECMYKGTRLVTPSEESPEYTQYLNEDLVKGEHQMRELVGLGQDSCTTQSSSRFLYSLF